MNHVPKLGVEVVAGAVPTPFVEQGPEGFDVEGDAIARRDRLGHIVGRQAIRKVELVVKPGLCSVVKCLGCQTKAGEGPEIVGFDPLDDPRAHLLGCGRRRVVHFSLKMYVQRESGLMGNRTCNLPAVWSHARTKRRAEVTVTRVASACDAGGRRLFHARCSSAKPTLTLVSRIVTTN